MDYLRNLPTGSPQNLADLLPCKTGQVISMSFFQSDAVQMTLLSFGKDESVSEEVYFGDTLYYILEGVMQLCIAQDNYLLHSGQVMAVPARTPHAIAAQESFKLLQITVMS